MDYVWDDAKAARHLAKHHVPFEYAARVFLDPWRLDAPDQRHDYGETRRVVLGDIDGRLSVVVYALRGVEVRIISARKANEGEKKRYDTFSAQGG